MHPFESSTWNWPHHYSLGAHHVPQPVCFPSNHQPGFLEQGYLEPSCVDPMFPFDPNSDIVAPKPSQESYYGIDNSQENHYPLQYFQENYFPVNNSLQNDTASKKVSSLTNNNYCPSLETSAFFLGIPIFQESNPVVLYHIPSTDLCYVYVRCELIDGRKSHYLCEGCFLKKNYLLAEVVDDCWFTKDPVYSGHICRPKIIKTELDMRQGTSVCDQRVHSSTGTSNSAILRALNSRTNA